MTDKKKNKNYDKNYNTLYKKKHWFAIKIKSQMYNRLPHVKERRKKYCEANKERIRAVKNEWRKNNPEKARAIQLRYYEKLKRRKKKKNMKSKILRVINEFLDYCYDRYRKDTVDHYKINMMRFHDFIISRSTKCPEYRRRYFHEQKKPKEERDLSWTKDFIRIQYSEQLDRDFITRYVSFVNHDELSPKANIPLNSSERESRLVPLKSFLKFCYRKGYTKKDFRKYVFIPPREVKVLKRALTQEEMIALLETPDTKTTLGIRDRALLELSYSGFRAEEMLQLKLNHVDVVTNTVTVIDAKGEKDRVVPMTSEAIFWIKIWFTKRKEFIKDRLDPEYLFLTRGTKPIVRKSFSIIVKKYAQKANIQLEVAPHDLRRATATHLVENGAPIRAVQAVLGHTTLKVTTKYLRLSDERIKKEHKATHPANRRKMYYGEVER